MDVQIPPLVHNETVDQMEKARDWVGIQKSPNRWSQLLWPMLGG